jgi:hypothetical protein
VKRRERGEEPELPPSPESIEQGAEPDDALTPEEMQEFLQNPTENNTP